MRTELETGVPELDTAHRVLLVSILVIEHTPPDSPQPHFQWIASDFLALWTGQIEDEEILLVAYGDPAAPAHRAEHSDMRVRLKGYLHALTQRTSPPGEVAAALRRWFHTHARFFDRSLGARVQQSSGLPTAGSEHEQEEGGIPLRL